MPVIEIANTDPKPALPRASLPTPADSSPEAMDRALTELAGNLEGWTAVPIPDRRAILQELIHDVAAVAPRWADLCRRAEGIAPQVPTAGEEWLVGPYMVLRNLQLLDRALGGIERCGHPTVPGPVRRRPSGQVTAQVFPDTVWDRVFYAGVTAEVWMDPEVRPEDLAETQAVHYARGDSAGGVSLVLGAGNVSSIGPMDALYKLFVENQVVMLKMHPVNAYLGPLIQEGFQALVDWGVLRLAYGGVDVGGYLCSHEDVDEIHITGSDKTVEAIVFGAGEEGRRNKAAGRRINTKPITSELGNVSPVIVVPGPWSPKDLAYHGENIASMLTNNAGFNCNAARVLIQHRGWGHRGALWDQVRRAVDAVPTRHAYYPGAAERYEDFVSSADDALELGLPVRDLELPWALIPDVDPEKGDSLYFRREAFCGVMSETALDAASPAEFLDRAVEFCNDTLWGTLNATVIVHPKSLADPETAAAFEGALEGLRYGTVAVNCWAAVGYGLVISPWGAYPGHDVDDIQSGSGFVHNTLMFDRIQKTVVRTPFRMSPKPLWFSSHATALEMARKVTEFEEDPSVLKLPGIFWEALRG